MPVLSIETTVAPPDITWIPFCALMAPVKKHESYENCNTKDATWLDGAKLRTYPPTSLHLERSALVSW